MTWTSANPAVATVDQNGVVKGIGEGTTTILVSANDGSGRSAACKVTVKDNSIISDGVIATVTNPYKDNKGVEHENTVLVGDDMSVRVRVMKGGQGLGNANVTLKMEKLYGNASNYFEIRDDYVQTDEDGYAVFTIGLRSTYADRINAVSGRYQSYTVTATEASSNQSAEIGVGFACIDLSGIVVENNHSILYPDIEPSDEASDDDTGIALTRSLDGVLVDEYVTSQIVSSGLSADGTTRVDDHRVYLNAEPTLIEPALQKSKASDEWMVTFPLEKENGESGVYSVYNNSTNETTTTIVESVPAGLKYITLQFAELNLSPYTAMYVQLYSESGAAIGNPEIITAKSNNSKSYQISRQTEENGWLQISIVSQGQVDLSAKGYVLSAITGPWATDTDGITTVTPIEGSVTWEDVTDVQMDTKYQITEWSYEEAKKYLPPKAESDTENEKEDGDDPYDPYGPTKGDDPYDPYGPTEDGETEDEEAASNDEPEYLNKNYKYSYMLPAFPHTGNAFIIVSDTQGIEKYRFAYPTVMDEKDENDEYTNVNKLAPPPEKTGIYAVQVTVDETKKAEGVTLTRNGNQLIVESEKPGMVALKATVKVDGLDEEELSKQNGGELYTSVQWAPLPTVEEDEVYPDFYALEGQTVTITAQLYDKNGNAKSKSAVKFTYMKDGEEVEITQKGQVLYNAGETGQNTVKVSDIMLNTDTNGQATLKLEGAGMGFIEELTATAEKYSVALSFDVAKAPSKDLTIGNVYWVDLGAAFIDSADVNEGITKTVNFGNKIAEIEKASTSAAGKSWRIGYLGAAQSEKFEYIANDDDAQGVMEFISIDNIPFKYQKSGEGDIKESDTKAATIYSEKIGTQLIEGRIDVATLLKDEESAKVKFHFYNEDGKVVSYNNVGRGTVAADNTGLELKMDWTSSGMKLNILTPGGINLDKNSKMSLYVFVTDNFGSPLKDVEVSYTLTGACTAEGKATTGSDGFIKIEQDAPKATGKCEVNVSAGGNIIKTAQINFVDNTGSEEFGIREDSNTTPAIQSLGNKQLKVYFTTRVNEQVVNLEAAKNMFKFEQVGQNTDVIKYQVTGVKMSEDYKAIILTLNQDIVNPTEVHKLTIEPYTDEYGITYELVDSTGQKLSTSTCEITPSQRTVK